MSTSTELQWKLDKLGQWSDPAEFEVKFETVSDNGNVAIKDGLAEVA
jgi:hypothetical protein